MKEKIKAYCHYLLNEKEWTPKEIRALEIGVAALAIIAAGCCILTALTHPQYNL
jgi:hypothetical protein